MTGQVSTGYQIHLFRVTFQSISFIAEAFVFVYLGLSTMYYISEYEFSYTFVIL